MIAEIATKSAKEGTENGYLLSLDEKFNKEIEKINNISNSNRYIWFNDRFWAFPETNDLTCDVEALIDYTCDVMRERFEA